MTDENNKRLTLRYYDENASEFYQRTVGMNMADKYRRFTAHLPAGASILDAGCGSGRDSRYFIDQGYQLTAMDGSAEMVRLASEAIGRPVLHLTFQEVAFVEQFDAIWASASLLHVERKEIVEVIQRLVRALKPGGIFFMSFKYGDVETIRLGRLYNFYDEPSYAALIAQIPTLRVLEVWQSEDPRPDRAGDIWLNAITQKQ